MVGSWDGTSIIRNNNPTEAHQRQARHCRRSLRLYGPHVAIELQLLSRTRTHLRCVVRAHVTPSVLEVDVLAVPPDPQEPNPKVPLEKSPTLLSSCKANMLGRVSGAACIVSSSYHYQCGAPTSTGHVHTCSSSQFFPSYYVSTWSSRPWLASESCGCGCDQRRLTATLHHSFFFLPNKLINGWQRASFAAFLSTLLFFEKTYPCSDMLARCITARRCAHRRPRGSYAAPTSCVSLRPHRTPRSACNLTVS